MRRSLPAGEGQSTRDLSLDLLRIGRMSLMLQRLCPIGPARVPVVASVRVRGPFASPLNLYDAYDSTGRTRSVAKVAIACHVIRGG
jgi:hypothetical protein